MISVSDSFKKAIKQDIRRIYGYVDVTYQDKNHERHAEAYPTVLQNFVQNGKGLVSGSKVLKKYATLENNYTKLDGTFIVWNENRIDSNGYTSSDTFENINDNTIVIESDSIDNIYVKGVTIFFKENLPFDFTVTFVDADNNNIIDNITNNTSYMYQYVFENEINLYQVILNITSIEKPKNRIRISSIDFTVGDLYEGNELVNFDVNEEIDLFMESLPSNTCTITLNNYPDNNGKSKFDPLNPTGITNLLTKDSTIKPYIGVLTEEYGVEYVPMGVFYLKNWSSNNDGKVTFEGIDVLEIIKSMDIPTVGNFISAHPSGKTRDQYLHDLTGIDFSLPAYVFQNFKLLNTHNFLEWLKLYLAASICYVSNSVYHAYKFNVTRDNIVKQSEYDNIIVDTIDRHFLISDVKYETKNQIKYVNIKYTPYTNTVIPIYDDPGFTTTHTLVSDNDYVWFEMGKQFYSANLSYTIVSGNGSATLIDYSNSMIYVKFTGEIGSVITITYSGITMEGYGTITDQTLQNDLEKGDSIKLDFTNFTLFDSTKNIEGLTRFYLTRDNKYKVYADTMGDPSLECGDVISIQTRYSDVNDGYKTFMITKQKFTYDGGLQCSIEGFGN